MYLFANENVLEFYPRFGFVRKEEYQYSLNYTPGQTEEIVFYYTPDEVGQHFMRRPYERDGALFVKTRARFELPKYVKHPVTSEA
jgi:hypothetical protein